VLACTVVQGEANKSPGGMGNTPGQEATSKVMEVLDHDAGIVKLGRLRLAYRAITAQRPH
jgi:hypothetical protein